MNNNTDIRRQLLERKAALQMELLQKRELIRQDIQDMKQDINPLRAAGALVKNILQPQTGQTGAGSDIWNVGIASGVGRLIGRYLPGPVASNIGMALAPVVYQNVVSHVVPVARKGLVNALEWVVEKTEKQPEKSISENAS